MINYVNTHLHICVIKANRASLQSQMTQRGVRVVEGARLESVYAGNCIESSNLFLSAPLKRGR